eukprot:1775947-Amphidinium_carterae.2
MWPWRTWELIEHDNTICGCNTQRPNDIAGEILRRCEDNPLLLYPNSYVCLSLASDLEYNLVTSCVTSRVAFQDKMIQLLRIRVSRELSPPAANQTECTLESGHRGHA